MPQLKLSQRDRLLLHLYEIDPSRDDVEVPLGASQEGISRRLGTQVHNASRALASLEQEGLVADRLAHIRGAPKRRRAYFLTTSGKEEAERLLGSLMHEVVAIEDGGIVRETTFAGLLQTTREWNKASAVLDLVDTTRSSNVTNLRELRTRLGTEQSKRVSLAQGRQEVGDFFGRNEEKRRIESWFRDPLARVLLILGIAGIGKSTLASWAYEANLGQASQVWLTCRDWEAESSVVSTLADFFTSAGSHELAVRIRSPYTPADLFGPTLKDLSATRPVIFIDNLEKARDSLLPYLTMLTEAVHASDGAKLLLVSRSVPTFFPVGRDWGTEIELAGLTEAAARELAASVDLPDLDRAVNESRGHPLLLRLMAASGAAQAKGDMTAFLEREVSSSLRDDEIDVLETLAVYRHPVPVHAVRDLNPGVLSLLKSKGFVSENDDGVSVHDLLADFFLSRVGASRLKELHSMAADFCMHHIEERWFMEGFYHAVLAEEKDLTRSILIEHGENLALSFPAEIRDLLAIASRWYVRTELEVEALSTMALAQEELKQDKAALETYERLLTILEGREGIEAAPLLQRKARLQVSSQLWDQAFESHDRALRLYQSSGDRSGEARELLSLGSAYRRKGEGAKAKQAILESLSISKEMEDSAGEATALNNLGLQEWDEGGISRAEELLETAAAKAHQASDAYGEANALENLAMILKEQYKYEGAVNRLADAAAAFLRAGDRLECKRATASRAELLGEMGKSEEGIEICRKTIVDQSLMQPGRFMMRAGLDRGHADLQRALVHLLRDEGRLREAATEAERLEGMIGSIGDKRLLAKSMVERAEILEEVGDEREALLVLERAGSDLQKQGDAEGLAVVHMRAASIRRRAGDHGRSRSELDEALRQSVISGNELLEGVVLEELGTSLPKGDERRGTLQKAMETYNRLRRREDAERVRQLMEE